MSSVTQLVPNYLGGVSNQPDDKKLPGQVQDCINAYPDPTFGLTKRPGFKFLSDLKDGVPSGGTAFDNTDLDTAKWFYINRDSDERYIGCIVGNATPANAAIHVWNAIPDSGGVYQKCTVNYEANGLDANSLPNNSGGYEPRNYLSALTANDYDVLTIQDTYYITNKLKTVEKHADPSFNERHRGTVKLTGVEASTYEIKFKIDGGATTTGTYTAASTATTDEILTDLAGDFSGVANLTVTKIGVTLEFEYNAKFTLEVKGGIKGDFLYSYQDDVASLTDLPNITKNGRIVKVLNTGAIEDDYYVKFEGTGGIDGAGLWIETVSPYRSTGIKETTMVHELVCTNKNTFNFQPILWVKRKAGDDVTNEHPSFITKKIQQAFFYNNRLGFLTEDNVSMSQSADFTNLYATSARTLVDSDPIDLNVSSTRPAKLHGIIPTAQGLILFSQNQQFILFAADGNLSPKTALIRALSNYRMDNNIDPVEVGTGINFVTKAYDSGGFTRVFSMVPRGNQESPDIIDIGRTVSEYIPSTVDSLISSPQNSFIALYGRTIKDVYFYRTYREGDRELIRAWFNWKLPGTVQFISAESDTMYMVVKNGTGANARYSLLSAALTLTPEETVLVDSNGRKINPYMDFYAKTSSVSYDSTNNLSKCYLPFSDNTELEPVLVIAGEASFSGITESGFTITPERGSDGTGAFYSVKGKDLTDQASNVYVGFKYNYDVKLPRTYYQRQGQQTSIADYTANLTISRMKFSVGLASVVNFKLRSQGFEGNLSVLTAAAGSTLNVTANGTSGPTNTTTVVRIPTTTNNSGSGMTVDATLSSGVVTALVVNKEGTGYAVNDVITIDKSILGTAADVTATVTALGTTEFPYIGYTDVNDVAVKINGVATTAFTVADNKVTLTDPPGKDVEVRIYLANWEDIAGVKEADYYLADDVPLDEFSVFTVPIHQRTDNFYLRVFSDSPFPVSLTSMMWEGNYSPRYYRRT